MYVASQDFFSGPLVERGSSWQAKVKRQRLGSLTSTKVMFWDTVNVSKFFLK